MMTLSPFEKYQPILQSAHEKIYSFITKDVVQFRNGLTSISISVFDLKFIEELKNELDKIKPRIQKKNARILVAGDVNAGKSTFINLFIGLSIMPVSEQPCTESFCEIEILKTHDQNKTGIRLTDYGSFDISESNFQNTFSSQELESFDQFKNCITKETEAPKFFRATISLDYNQEYTIIDSPGLNSDSLATTALFAKQDDIDLIIFVIDACNHLTLSAQEFLTSVSRAKQGVFFIVSKIDMIKSLKKCEQAIIKQLSNIFPDKSDYLKFTYFFNFTFCDTSNLNALKNAIKEFVSNNYFELKVIPLAKSLCGSLEKLSSIFNSFEDSLLNNAKKCDDEFSHFISEYDNILKISIKVKHSLYLKRNCCLHEFVKEIENHLYLFKKDIVKWISEVSLFEFFKPYYLFCSFKKYFEERRIWHDQNANVSFKKSIDNYIDAINCLPIEDEKLYLSDSIDFHILPMSVLADSLSVTRIWKSIDFSSIFKYFSAKAFFLLVSSANFIPTFIGFRHFRIVFLLCSYIPLIASFYLDYKKNLKGKIIDRFFEKVYDNYTADHHVIEQSKNVFSLQIKNLTRFVSNSFLQKINTRKAHLNLLACQKANIQTNLDNLRYLKCSCNNLINQCENIQKNQL